MLDESMFTSEEDVVLASSDFFQPEGRPPIAPGRYVSKSRTLEQSTTSKGAPCIKVKFEKFEDTKGNTVRDFPPFETLYFNLRKVFGGTGEISSVGAYLKACGLKWNGLTKAELIEQLNMSVNLPVTVIVGWEQDYKELEDTTWFNPKTGQNETRKEFPKKTAFFKDEKGSYQHQVSRDGRTYTARSRVVGYEKIK